jgi:hypothetical protein
MQILGIAYAPIKNELKRFLKQFPMN